MKNVKTFFVLMTQPSIQDYDNETYVEKKLLLFHIRKKVMKLARRVHIDGRVIKY